MSGKIDEFGQEISLCHNPIDKYIFVRLFIVYLANYQTYKLF